MVWVKLTQTKSESLSWSSIKTMANECWKNPVATIKNNAWAIGSSITAFVFGALLFGVRSQPAAPIIDDQDQDANTFSAQVSTYVKKYGALVGVVVGSIAGLAVTGVCIMKMMNIFPSKKKEPKGDSCSSQAKRKSKRKRSAAPKAVQGVSQDLIVKIALAGVVVIILLGAFCLFASSNKAPRSRRMTAADFV